MLPYYYDELHRARTIDGEFMVKRPQELDENKRCAPNPTGHFQVVMSQLSKQEGSGFDFKKIDADPPVPILAKADDAAGLLATQGLQVQTTHPDAKACRTSPLRCRWRNDVETRKHASLGAYPLVLPDLRTGVC